MPNKKVVQFVSLSVLSSLPSVLTASLKG